MTKVMFQVGLLGFFVSALYYGTQGIPLMGTVVRSFIVFIAIVLGQAVIFVVLASMKHASKSGAGKKAAEHRPAPPPAEPQSPQAAMPS